MNTYDIVQIKNLISMRLCNVILMEVLAFTNHCITNIVTMTNIAIHGKCDKKPRRNRLKNPVPNIRAKNTNLEFVLKKNTQFPCKRCI